MVCIVYMAKLKNNIPHSQHFLSSLGIAIIAHLMVIVALVQFNEKNPYLTTVNPYSLIPVKISSEAKTGTAMVAGPRNKIAKKSGSLTGVALNKMDGEKPASLHADGAGDEVGREGELLESTKTSTVNFEGEILSYEAPTYPRLAQKRGLEGSVTIRLKITPEGLPVEPKLIKSSGHDLLDQAALKTALRWRFHQRSTPDFALVDKTIIFKLNE